MAFVVSRVSAPRASVRSSVSRRSVPTIVARRGGNVLDRPDTSTANPEIKRSGWDGDKDGDRMETKPQTEGGKGGTDNQRGSGRGGGNYRVLLLNSPSHTERGVVTAITQVIPNTNEDHAKNCYATAKSLGMALVCSVLKEHAEFYAQQLYRFGCKTAIEPDTATA